MSPKGSLFFSAISLLLAASAASAQTGPFEPPLYKTSEAVSIQASTVVAGHPASPKNGVGHQNYEHPALAMVRAYKTRTIDANEFIVQPPTSVAWIAAPASNETLLADLNQLPATGAGPAR